MRRKKLFISGKKARSVRKEILTRRKLNHSQDLPETYAPENKQPSWVTSFFDDISKSSPLFAESFLKSVE